MPLIYITGVAGVGKSTVRNELLKRGYETYGTDEDRIAAFYNNETGKMIYNPLKAPPHTKEWRDAHTWKMSRPRVERLALKANNKTVFLCGIADNDDEVWDLFSSVIALTSDRATLTSRLATRTTNSYGKKMYELKDILERQHIITQDYTHKGAVLIDSTRPLDVVIKDILDTSFAT